MRSPKTYLLICLAVLALIISCAAFYNLGEENGFKRAEKANLEATYNAGYEAGHNANTESSSDTDDYDRTVYVTQSGERYHRNGCQYLSKSSKELPLRTALARNYTACSKCNP